MAFRPRLFNQLDSNSQSIGFAAARDQIGQFVKFEFNKDNVNAMRIPLFTSSEKPKLTAAEAKGLRSAINHYGDSINQLESLQGKVSEPERMKILEFYRARQKAFKNVLKKTPVRPNWFLRMFGAK